MRNGIVKFFNKTKGFGFITPDDGEKDVFVHITKVEDSGLTTLEEGQKVSFEVEMQSAGESAISIKIIPELKPIPIEHYLKFLIIKRKLSLDELAVELNISQSRLSNVASGEDPVTTELAQKLSDYFEKPINFWSQSSILDIDIDKEVKEVSKKSFTKLDFIILIKELEQYTDTDNTNSGNYKKLKLSAEQLAIIRHSLHIAISAADLPEWSKETVKLLNGILAVLSKLRDFIPKALWKSWDNAIKGLQEALGALRTQKDESE